jgi:hypothetical protein
LRRYYCLRCAVKADAEKGVDESLRGLKKGGNMCRKIKTLFNFAPPATEEEIRDASLQFVRKISGFTNPSKANEEFFYHAVEHVSEVAKELLGSLVTNAEPRNREIEAERAHVKSVQRFGL